MLIPYKLSAKYFLSYIIVISILFNILLVITNLKADENGYLPIAANKINLRKQPTLESEIITQLNCLDYVKILKIQNQNASIDGKEGKWVYVLSKKYDDSCMNECKGWVFDYYIAYPQRYNRVDKWKVQQFNSCAGDFCPHYTFLPNGAFKMRLAICHGSDCNEDKKKNLCQNEKGNYLSNGECEYNGHLYRYLNIIKAVTDNNTFNYLIINKLGQICLPDSLDPCSE